MARFLTKFREVGLNGPQARDAASGGAGTRPLLRPPVMPTGRATGVAGFFSASSMERHPAEVAITENMRRFKRFAREAVPAQAASASTPAALAVGGTTRWH